MKEIKLQKAEIKAKKAQIFLSELPVPDRKLRIIYVDDTSRIPNFEQGYVVLDDHATLIPIDNVDKFNEVMTGIFRNPHADSNRGGSVANAIEIVLKTPISFLRRTPAEADRGKQDWRKLRVARKTMGVYAMWNYNTQMQTIILTTAHKNTRIKKDGTRG